MSRYIFQKSGKVMIPEEGVENRNKTKARREEVELEGKKIGDDHEKEEVDMGEKQKKGKEEETEEDEEHVEEIEVNNGAKLHVEALN